MAKKCKVCGRCGHDYKKLKAGIICSDCMNALPIGVKNSINEFTADQIQKIKEIIKPYDGKNKIWRYCDGFQVTGNSIILNRMEYKIKDLVSVKLNFHPGEIGKLPNTAEGIISLILELKTPHILIEESFINKRITARYIISGMDIIYHYSKDLEYTINAIQAAIQDKTYIIKEAYKEEKNTDAGKQSNQSGYKQKKRKNRTSKMTPLESAMELFSIKRPFTKSELRKKRNIFIASNHIHPDDGGSEEAFRKVQDAYELLIKFASD